MSESSSWPGLLASDWEHRVYEPERPDAEAPPGFDDPCDYRSPDELTVQECSEECHHLLVSLKLRGVLSAKAACTLSFWAKGAGMVGLGTSLALSPSRTGGAFSAKFDDAVGIDMKAENDAIVQRLIPGHEQCTYEPTLIPHDALVVHHVLQEAVVRADVREMLQQHLDDESWGPRWSEHEVVRSAGAGELVMPVALFLDGVNFQPRDDAVGFWMQSLTTNQRYLLLTLRQQWFCQCGCNGWCTLYAAFEYVAWLLSSLQAGVFPIIGLMAVLGQKGRFMQDLQDED